MASTRFGAAHIGPVEHTLLVATVVVWAVLEIRQGRNHRAGATNADHGSRGLIRITSLVGVGAGLLLARIFPGGAIRPYGTISWVGLGMLWCGIALRLWSFHTLGRYFTFTVQTSADQPVITGGPYRVVRHPSYAAVLVAYFGVSLLVGNWWFLLGGMTGMTVGVLNRIRVEDRALSADLGAAYQSYAATHKRLIPFIW
jgi:protein-S-isoprenylcysteine O-methyltransferase Ste14